MLKKLFASIGGRVLLTLVVINIVIGVVAPMLHWYEHIPVISNIILILYSFTIWWHNTKFVIALLSWVFPNKYFVELVDFQGDRHFTLATKRDGCWHAPVYFSSNVGHVILKDDGTIDKDSDSLYISYWLPVNKNKRVIHILSNNLPILDQ